jgi:hypothetical protein
MLRLAIIAIALGTILASWAGSANATAVTSVDLVFSIVSGPSPLCGLYGSGRERSSASGPALTAPYFRSASSAAHSTEPLA